MKNSSHNVALIAAISFVATLGGFLAGLFLWGSNFLVTMTFPVMLAGIGLAAACSIYAFFAALSIIFIAKMISETRGLSLEEMKG